MVKTDRENLQFIWSVLKQHEQHLKFTNWKQVAEDQQMTKDHAARMRFFRLKRELDGPGAAQQPRIKKSPDSDGNGAKTEKTEKRKRRGAQSARKKIVDESDDEEDAKPLIERKKRKFKFEFSDDEYELSEDVDILGPRNRQNKRVKQEFKKEDIALDSTVKMENGERQAAVKMEESERQVAVKMEDGARETLVKAEEPQYTLPIKMEVIEEPLVEEICIEGQNADGMPVHVHSYHEQPVEEQPVEEQPVEEQPIEEQPVEEQPIEEQPVEHQSFGYLPVEEQPIKEQSDDRPDGKIEEATCSRATAEAVEEVIIIPDEVPYSQGIKVEHLEG